MKSVQTTWVNCLTKLRQMISKNYCSEVFTFIDSTALVSKLSLREERDKAITAGYERLNNEVLPEVSVDSEAKIGAKSNKGFWYCFKNHVAIDMQHGVITRVAVMAPNVADSDGAKHVMPRSGAAVADKGYIRAIREMLRRGVHPMVILDRFISKLRGSIT